MSLYKDTPVWVWGSANTWVEGRVVEETVEPGVYSVALADDTVAPFSTVHLQEPSLQKHVEV